MASLWNKLFKSKEKEDAKTDGIRSTNCMRDIFTSIETEHEDPLEAVVEGSIPDWLHGSLYRNGPAKFEFGEDAFKHWFDGSAMIHRFHIKEGRVTYQNRFLRTDSFLKNSAANRIVVSEFGTCAHPDPCKTLFERFFSYFSLGEPTDNTLVNVFPVGDGLYAATETQHIRKFHPVTLETQDKVDLKAVAGVNGGTAHPHTATDGTVYNLGSVIDQGYHYAIFKMLPPAPNADGSSVVHAGEIVAKIKPRSSLCPSYFHSFGITENYFILLEQPVYLNVLKLFTSKIRRAPFSEAIGWDTNMKNIFHVIDRKTGTATNEFSYVAREQFFTFHHGNAYEENGFLVLDLSCHTDPNVFNSINLVELRKLEGFEPFKGVSPPSYRRYVLPLDVASSDTEDNVNMVNLPGCSATAIKQAKKIVCHYDLINEGPFEFPQINYKKNGNAYRYAYGSYGSHQLMKIDLQTREVKQWTLDGAYPSEPLFIEAPNAQTEDDGVVLSVVLIPGSHGKHRSVLLVLDAKTMTELARACVDVLIPLGFHGYFYKDH